MWVHNSCSKLRRNFIRAGFKVVGQAAHHIVAQGAKAAVDARAILLKFGIDVNSLENGVLLKKVFHAGIHTRKYYDSVLADLQEAVDRGGTDDAIRKRLVSKLRRIAGELVNNKYTY